MEKCLIIAEAGVNHNGSKKLALELIDAAAEAGADIVKFQTFKTELLVSKNAEKASYQKRETPGKTHSQYEMLKELELSYDFHHELVSHCQKKGIEFMSTAFDFESLDFLVRELKCETLKIGSGELTNAPFLYAHGQTGKNIILSTGMATFDEIQASLGVLLMAQQGKSPQGFNKENFISIVNPKSLKDAPITLLHCTTEYPAPIAEVNLNSILFLREKFGLNIGYSDHTKGIHIASGAVSLGAKVIEKHFTLDRALEGPDHKASLEPSELKEMVRNIRDIEKALGGYQKKPSPSELQNKKVARKGLYIRSDIDKGDLLKEENFSILRPENQASLYEYWSYLGKKVSKSYKKGDSFEP